MARRTQATINNNTTTYLYDGHDIVAELGQNPAQYLRTDHIDEAIARYTAEGDHYLLTDLLGSTLILANDQGTTTTTYTYSPFGETQTQGETSDNPTQYTGRENDETGLYYYRARYYAPGVGRFISEDPIGLEGGINRYVYVDNAPTMYVDPTGELPSAVGGALVGAAIDIGIQLALNGGRMECIKWDVVAIAALAGAVNPFSGLNAANSALKAERQFARAAGLCEGSRAATRTAQRGDRHNSRSMKEAASWAGVEGAAEGVGSLIPDEQHIRIGNSCECR